MNNKNKKIAELIMFVIAFMTVIAVTIASIDKMSLVEFFAAGFALSFAFACIAGKEYLYKMPVIIVLAITVASIIMQKLTLPIFLGTIAGAIVCIVFLWIYIKIHPNKEKRLLD